MEKLPTDNKFTDIYNTFVSLSIAKKLKSIGFNELCFAYYTSEGIHITNGVKKETLDKKSYILLPTWEQAADFCLHIHHTIIDENLYFSYNKQQWALADMKHPDREDDMFSEFFENKHKAREIMFERAIKRIKL
jgi:hypothetical protein